MLALLQSIDGALRVLDELGQLDINALMDAEMKLFFEIAEDVKRVRKYKDTNVAAKATSVHQKWKVSPCFDRLCFSV